MKRIASLKFLQLLVVITFTIAKSEKVWCPKREREALLSLKQDLKGDPERLSSWRKEDEDCCLWSGIRCSNRTGHVTHLEIGSLFIRPLVGKISPALLELQQLEYVDMGFNDFLGNPFPSFNSSSFPRLTHLNLAGAGIRDSSVLPHVANLSNLQYLDLGRNNYVLSNLDWLRSLSSLTYLDLSLNNMSEAQDWLQVFNNLPHLQTLQLAWSSFPSHLAFTSNASKSLASLDLFGSSISSSVLYPWLGNMSSKLVSLNLSNIGLNGSIPSIFGNMVSLEYLDLSQNRLKGSIPAFLGTLHNLQTLDISWNQLHGSLPYIAGLSSLKHLYIQSNNLSGAIPKVLGCLSELETLDASHNFFHGVMSEAHFKNLSKLSYIDLSFNSLAMNISSNWIPPFQLDYISLKFCKLGPDFPKWLQSQRNFSRLDISSAGISSPIPLWFWDLPTRNTVILDLSNNQMNGTLPDLTSKTLFHGIDLSFNRLEGPLPMFPSNVTSLNLTGNMLSGSISSFCNMKYKSLSYLDLSNNSFSGGLSNCFMSWQQLGILNLANNGFSGGIPTSVGSLSNLEALILRNNNLSGTFPLGLEDCIYLKFLDLGHNQLHGEIPIWISLHLPDLKFLRLQGNAFSGEIPIPICQLTDLLILDLSQNNLSGSIPKCISNLTAMTEERRLNGAFNFPFSYSDQLGGSYTGKTLVKWKGREYEYGSSLELFRIIDLANNKLSGGIPKEMMNLSQLVVLNLSSNNLQGYIPGNIGQLKQLQSLDLSANRLSSSIPSSIVDLSFLSYLNLSYNNLSGSIPTGTQLMTFGESAFIGNNDLCGLPLSKKCKNPVSPVSPTNDRYGTNNEETDEFWKMFYISMGTGFAVAFWGVSCSLLLKRSWRHAYFRFLDDIKDSIYVKSVLFFAKIRKTSNAHD